MTVDGWRLAEINFQIPNCFKLWALGFGLERFFHLTEQGAQILGHFGFEGKKTSMRICK